MRWPSLVVGALAVGLLAALAPWSSVQAVTPAGAPSAPVITDGEAGSVSVRWEHGAAGIPDRYLISAFGAGDSTVALRTLETDGDLLTITFYGLPAEVVRFRVATSSGAWSEPSVYTVPPFRSLTSFVRQQAHDFGLPAPSDQELAARVQALASGAVAPGTMIEDAAAGPNWAPFIDPVARLYLAYFARVPDAGGVNFWADQLRAGRSLSSISSAFAQSRELVRSYGNLGNRAFVARVYRNVLDRFGDAGGVAYWTGVLDRGERTRGQLMVAFSESSEHQLRRAGEVNAVTVYLGMLRRVPTPLEMASWDVKAAGSRRPVIDLLLLSDAYGNLI